MRKLTLIGFSLVLLATVSTVFAVPAGSTGNCTLYQASNVPATYAGSQIWVDMVHPAGTVFTGSYSSTIAVDWSGFSGTGGEWFDTGNSGIINWTSTFETQAFRVDANFGAIMSYDITACEPDAKPIKADTDPDNDGISAGNDNCPQTYNPHQEDGWGSTMGDACDTDWYNLIGQGVAGFVQKNGVFHLHGNCIYLDDGDPRCPVIAAFDPAAFDTANMPMEISSGDAGTWSVWLHYLHSNNGVDVYQVNIYSTNPPHPDTLIDDRLEIHVSGDNWQWYHRGGHPDYHGN
jgi:hypothetical protein